jgi:acetyl/propionyl-CoA carboxylase alpha subunit
LDIALEEFFVEGVKTNIPLMRGILHSKAFAESRMSGEFLSEPKDRETLVNLLKSDEDFEQAALVATLSPHRDGDTLKACKTSPKRTAIIPSSEPLRVGCVHANSRRRL